MYKIKSKPEDFYVKELLAPKLTPEGNYAYFKLKKKGYGTQEVLRVIEKVCGIPLRFVNYSGLKDKHAVTEQYISVKQDFASRLTSIALKDISFEQIGRSDERLALGMHTANYFEIVVRNIEEEPNHPSVIPNYFDEQRFSTNNAEIGKLLIQGKFKEACELILEKNFDLERKVKEQIEKDPGNYVSAIRQIPNKILRLYVHAYQSLLFNKLLSNYVEYQSKESRLVPYSQGSMIFTNQPIPNTWIPLIGFSSELKKSEEDLLAEDNITPRNFIIRSIPDISSEGSQRAALINLRDLKIGTLEEDELNEEKKKCKLSFTLAPGSYATIVIKSIFS